MNSSMKSLLTSLRSLRLVWRTVFVDGGSKKLLLDLECFDLVLGNILIGVDLLLLVFLALMVLSDGHNSHEVENLQHKCLIHHAISLLHLKPELS